MSGTVVRRRRAGGNRRDGVLSQAVEVLADRGYHQTRFRDVAEVSGLAVSTLQSYFGSREDMLVEALQRATDGEVEAMEKAGASVEGEWARVVALVDRGLATPRSVWRMLAEFWAAAAHDEELRRQSVDLQRRYRASFEAALRGGVDAGVFTPSRDVVAIVDVLVATLDGLCFPRVLDQPHPEHDSEFRAVVLDQLATTLGVAR